MAMQPGQDGGLNPRRYKGKMEPGGRAGGGSEDVEGSGEAYEMIPGS